jgi:hypothetical protein
LVRIAKHSRQHHRSQPAAPARSQPAAPAQPSLGSPSTLANPPWPQPCAALSPQNLPVEDLVSNFLKKRIVITVNTAGLQAWTLTVNFKDTPQGLKIDNELIMGAAPVGYDPEDPSKGAPAEAAVIVNENLVKKTFDDYAPGGNVPGSEFTRSLNAITRHVVEEFSMFRFFLPQVWHRFPHLQGMFAVGDAIGSFVPR